MSSESQLYDDWVESLTEAEEVGASDYLALVTSEGTRKVLGALLQGSTLPVSDATYIVYDSAAPTTRKLRIDVGALSAPRVLSMPDADVDLANMQTQGDVLDDLNTLGAVTADGEMLVGTGAGAFAWESGATLRTSIGVDAAGTDNSTNVTLAGTPDYLTLSGQEITLGLIDLAADVTGQLPQANIADDSVGANQLIDTAVVPGSYTNANVTIDDQGRITAASSGSAGSSGFTVDLNKTDTAITVGDDEDGNWYYLTAGSDILLTLDPETTPEFALAILKATDANVTVQAGNRLGVDTVTVAAIVSENLTGQTSGATAKVVAVRSGRLILGPVTDGPFDAGGEQVLGDVAADFTTTGSETQAGYKDSGVARSDSAATASFTITGYAEIHGETNASNDAVFRVLGQTSLALEEGGDLTVEGILTANGTLVLGDTLSAVDNVISRAELQDYSETLPTPSSASGTLTLDLETGNVFKVVLTEDVSTLAISNWPASGKFGTCTIIIIQDSTPRTFAFTGVLWPGGAAPTVSTGSGAIDVVTITSYDAGTTKLGFVGGQDFS